MHGGLQMSKVNRHRTREQAAIASLLAKLVAAERTPFPPKRERLDAPEKPGVYVIFDPRGRVLHVGMTPRARKGIRQRLRDHMARRSSFVKKYLSGNVDRLRDTHAFAWLVVPNRRHRALLEALAIGTLCPAHIGHS